MDWNLDPFYTDTCSAATIQSNKRGFFFDYVDHVLDTVGTKWLQKKFANVCSDTERLHSLLTDKKASAVVLETLQHVSPLYRGKDAVFSRERRLQGDAALRNGDAKKAAGLYSQAVLRAPTAGLDLMVDGGLSLSLALWCRAGALIELTEDTPPLCETGRPCAPGALALADLQEASKAGLPQTQRGEMYRRMGKCYAVIGEYAKAKVSFGLSRKMLDEGGDLEAFSRLELDLQELEMLMEEKPSNKQKKFDSMMPLPELAGGEHVSMRGTSANITITEGDADSGRYITAAKPLKTGDAVLVELPVAACLSPDRFGTHCYHCFERLQAPVGCPDCAAVAFCSVQCRDKSLGTYHRYECHYLDLLIGSGMSILCHVALRCVAQCSSPAEAIASLTGSNTPLGALCTHRDRRAPRDYAMRALMALFLTTCLKRSGYFGTEMAEDDKDIRFNKEELQVAATFVHLLQMMQFNAHEFYETRLGADHRFKGSKFASIGVAIYPTASLFNHDCYPAVTRYFNGCRIILRCIRPLAVGEVVAENYGPIFTMRGLSERQRSLGSRYWFKCGCQACQEDWPVFKNMNNNARLRCPTPRCNKLLQKPADPQKKVRCTSCKKNVSLLDQILEVMECEQQYHDAAQLMEEQNGEAAIPVFCAAIDRFHRIASGPHKDTHIAQESLRSCMADKGNVYRTQKPAPKENIQHIASTSSSCTITEID